MTAVVIGTSIGSAAAQAATTPTDRVAAIASSSLGSAPVHEFRGTVTANGVTVSTAKEASRSLTADVKGGKAVVAVLNSGSEATFDLGLPVGSQLDEQPDGAVTVSKSDVGGVSVQAVVEAPWAKDTNGKSLPTKYEVKGSKLIQHIDTRGAEYPIVADPSIVDYGYYGLATPVVYIQWTKGQTRSLNDQVMGQTVAVAIGAACGEIPHALGKIACLALATYKYNEFKNAVSVAVRKKGCLKARVPVLSLPTGTAPVEAIRALWFYDHTC